MPRTQTEDAARRYRSRERGSGGWVWFERGGGIHARNTHLLERRGKRAKPCPGAAGLGEIVFDGTGKEISHLIRASRPAHQRRASTRFALTSTSPTRSIAEGCGDAGRAASRFEPASSASTPRGVSTAPRRIISFSSAEGLIPRGERPRRHRGARRQRWTARCGVPGAT